MRPLLDLLASPRVARVMERVADTPLPSPVMRGLIHAYARTLKVDLDEAGAPVASYPTLNAFFTRTLRENARPITAPSGVMVSPADGLLSTVARLDAQASLPEHAVVKGQRWRTADLVGAPTPDLAKGHALIVYLSPRDYHRVHAPCDGTVRSVVAIPGAHYPVNRLGLKHVPGLFTRNLRTVFTVDTETHGCVRLIMVGATNVGRITSAVSPGQAIRRGDELGTFNLGSTVVLLWPDRDDNVAPQGPAPRPIKVGEPL